MITYRHYRNQHGEPVWTITIVDWHDIFRFSVNMLEQQCEFITAGSKALQWCRRSLGRSRFEQLNNSLSGKGTQRHAYVTRAARRPRRDA